MTTTTTPDELAAGALAAARALAPQFAQRSAESAAARTIPADLAAGLEDAGLFSMMLPRALGGLELSAPEIFQIMEGLSYADGSAGWAVTIGGSTSNFAVLDHDRARELLGDRPRAASTFMLSPTGTATATDGGYLVSGRWGFNSGAPHAVFGQVSAVHVDADGQPVMTDFGPDIRTATFRMDQAQIHDTWRSAGLAGSGSHDVVLDGVFVPEHLFVDPLLLPPRHDGPLSKFNGISGVNLSSMGWPIGVARRALDEFAGLAKTKKRGRPPVLLFQDRNVLLEYGRAEGRVQAARAYGKAVVDECWATATSGQDLSGDQRARLTLALQHAVRECVAAVDAVYRLAGAGISTQPDHPLTRAFHDLHAVDTHLFSDADSLQRYGQVRFGAMIPPQFI
jgi:indole-3-acetate monooxygenase